MPTTRFGHMELTLPLGSLNQRRRDDIGRFCGEVFGWTARDVPVENGFLLRTDPEVSQFILLAEAEQPMHAPGNDHLGLEVETRAEVDALLARCQRYEQTDARVELKTFDEDFVWPGQYTIHAFYVRYLLPIYFDVHCYEYVEEKKPARWWTFG